MDSVAPFVVAILSSMPLVLGKTERNQICEFAMSSGSFKGELLSITWASNSNHLRVRFFIKTAGLYTDVPNWNIGADGINMERGNLDEQAIKSFYITTGVLATEEITSIYEMRVEYSGHAGWLLLVITEKSQYMFNSYPSNPTLLWIEATKDEYAIVHSQELGNDWTSVWGYVIRKDNVDGRDGIIMHQLWLQRNQDWAIGVEGNPKFRHFYYLVWDFTALRLVHRSNGDMIPSVYESTKFRKIPRGFLSGDDMHLFDDELGCVAIVDFGHHIDLFEKFKEKKDLVFTVRYTVPFEKYFWCPEKFKANLSKSLDPYRCSKVGRSIDSAGLGLKIGGISMLSIGGIILVALLAIAVLVLLARKFFPKGSSKDMDSSNGSSKTGGKSSSKKKSRPGKTSTGLKKSRSGKSSTGSKKSSKTGLEANKSGAK